MPGLQRAVELAAGPVTGGLAVAEIVLAEGSAAESGLEAEVAVVTVVAAVVSVEVVEAGAVAVAVNVVAAFGSAAERWQLLGGLGLQPFEMVAWIGVAVWAAVGCLLPALRPAAVPFGGPPWLVAVAAHDAAAVAAVALD